MKPGIEEIVGKTVTGIVVAKSSEIPENQIFVLFSDDTYYELYGSSFTCASGVISGGIEEVHSYLSMFPKAEIKMEFFREGS